MPTNDLSISVQKQLKQELVDKRITKSQLARMAGRSREVIQYHFEPGQDMRLSTVERLAAVLGLVVEIKLVPKAESEAIVWESDLGSVCVFTDGKMWFRFAGQEGWTISKDAPAICDTCGAHRVSGVRRDVILHEWTVQRK